MKTINFFRSKLFAITLALMAGVSSFAYEFEYVNDFHIDGFAYSINSTSANNDSEEGYVGLIEIADCQKDVLVPKYVSYGDRGFHVTKFGMGSVVFTNEAGSVVESVTIPNTTYVINKNVLAGCPNLKTVVVDSENPYYDSRENCNAIITTSQNPYFTPNTLIAGCKTTIIPNSVVEIGANAFYNCQSLETITIPNSVTKIGRSAFNACSALSSITLSENLTAIGEWAFDDCNNLIEVVCYATQPPTISQYTFSGISPTIYVPAESIEQYRAANGWKDLQIQYISWSEGCEEYKHINLAVQMLPKISSMIFDISNNGTIEPPYVDSVWILKTEQEPLRKLDAQSGDTIDLSFLEENEEYILRVYINGCIKSRTFWHRVIPNNWPDTWCDTWNVMWFDGWRFDETASTSQYRLGKDTIIGDYTYSKFNARTYVRFTEDWKVYVYYEGFDDNDPYTPDLPTGEYLAYDFSAQVGDTLEVFSGVHSYSKYKCLVREVQTDPETKLRTITLFQLLLEDTDGDGVEEEYGRGEMTWIEGVGSPNGFLINTTLPGGGLFTLLCAYKDDELKYTGSFYERFGCDYNAGVISDDLFPTLSGLQRTICREYCEQADNKTLMEEYTNLTTRTENNRPYIYCSPFLLREEDNKILIYSRSLNKDLVLYDFNLQVGDSLPMLYIDTEAKDDWIADSDMEIWCVVDYHKDLEGNLLPADTLIVTDVSNVTLLDGKEYKKWTFDNGMEYVEGIGMYGGHRNGNFFGLIQDVVVPCHIGTHLVCVSKNNQLLYQMDDAEMERLGAECLCDVEKKWSDTWCDTWNVFVENGSVYPPHEETYRYQLAQDIVIGDYTYTAVVSKAINDALDAPRYVAAVRFTDDRKVYIYYDNAEYLLYDFNVQQGDELEVFAGINNYTSEIKTYKCTVTGVEQYACVGCPATITLEVHNHPDDFREFYRQTQWIEGVGDINGFLNGINSYINIPGNAAEYLLCAYQGDELKYTGDLYEEYGCGDNADDPQLPLVDWCNQWNILAHGYLGPQEPLYGAKTTIYQLGEDTIINHLRYKQLTRYASDDVNQTKTYVGAIRFTKNNRQVYFYYDNAEYLLYDFKAQVGDTLEVFAGIDNYRDNKTYKHVVTNKEPIEDEQCKVTLDVFVSLELEGEIIHEEKFTTTWIEGVGSPDGIVHNCATLREGNVVTDVLCAYVDDRRMYRTPYPDYRILGCEYNDGDFIEDAFPILSGLQRTICDEYCEDSKTSLQKFDEIRFEHDQPYIYCESAFLIREENNKILIYSHSLDKDLVLYDFTLEVGDSLPRLYLDESAEKDLYWIDYSIMNVVDYHKDSEGNILPADTLIVTDVSTITLLEGKEHKKWTFNNGMEYVEGIGSFGNNMWFFDFFQLIGNMDFPVSLHGTHLVCVSKNNQLLYQMDDTEMEQLETECLCEAENPEDLFPTLWGLQRTSCDEWYDGCGENKSYLFAPKEVKEINGKLYLKCGGVFLREEDSKVLIYSFPYEKDFVLYDYTLEVGGTLQNLGIDIYSFPELEYAAVVDYIAYEDYDVETDEFIIKKEPLGSKRVQEVSTITLLDGKEYKRWLFGNDWENGNYYVEGIGNVGGSFGGDYINIANPYALPTCYMGEHLVCVSKNNKLLYMMDDAEMERLGAECLCDVEKKWSDTWCDTWNIMEHNVQLIGDYNEETWRYYLAEDTTINGTTYTPVNRYWTADKTKRGFVATIRFTEDQKVYALLGDTEYLVYDFSVQVGDTIETIVGVNCGTMLQQLLVHQVDIDDATNRKTITLYPLCQLEEDVDCDRCDENGYYLDLFPIQWIEGVGSTDGFLMGDRPCSDWVGGIGHKLLCAYKDDELQYINDLYQDDYGCEYNAVGQNPEALFPTLWGLQRTVCNEYCGENEDDNSDNITYKQTFTSISFENNKPYILCRGYLLREESNKILLYSESLNKEIVLYDFTLEVGDSLPAYIEHFDETIYPADTLVVTDVSYVTLLDGKEYKKWTFDNGMEYVEGIGMYGGHRNGNFVGLIQELVVPCHTGTHLVCVSKNGKLLYQMDDAEMERLGAECLCDYDNGPRKDNAKNGKIGGRPTPTQWNMLEVDLREMENSNTILRAETFSYTLENDSIVANAKTFYQLARQSTKDTAITKSFVGALHFSEDEGNRVYFLHNGVEYLLYDFTAEPGDTVEIFAGINNYPQETTYTHVVRDKDTLENGACRMFLEVVFPDESNTGENTEKVWLAGLGSVDGIVHNATKQTRDAYAAPSRSARSSETHTSIMLCAWREDSCLYTTDHPDYDNFGCVYNQDPTSVSNTPSPMTDCQKLLRDGHLLIIYEGKTYNVLGMPIQR